MNIKIRIKVYYYFYIDSINFLSNYRFDLGLKICSALKRKANVSISDFDLKLMQLTVVYIEQQ